MLGPRLSVPEPPGSRVLGVVVPVRGRASHRFVHVPLAIHETHTPEPTMEPIARPSSRPTPNWRRDLLRRRKNQRDQGCGAQPQRRPRSTWCSHSESGTGTCDSGLRTGCSSGPATVLARSSDRRPGGPQTLVDLYQRPVLGKGPARPATAPVAPPRCPCIPWRRPHEDPEIRATCSAVTSIQSLSPIRTFTTTTSGRAGIRSGWPGNAGPGPDRESCRAPIWGRALADKTTSNGHLSRSRSARPG
jgi:hypothetical protein